MLEEKKRYCLNDGKEIVGRAGKMFCSDGCRNTYNNRQNKDATNLIRNINNKLRKNYRILSELNPNDKVKVERKLLKKKGFDFDVFTGILNAKRGKSYFLIYNQSYQELEENIFILIKTEL